MTRFRPPWPAEYIRDIEQEHLPGDKRRLTEIEKLSLSRTVAATALTSIANELMDAFGSVPADDAGDSVTDTIVRRVLQELHTHLKGERWKHFVSPVLSVVAALPKAELASMAESLVNLTSMKPHNEKQHRNSFGFFISQNAESAKELKEQLALWAQNRGNTGARVVDLSLNQAGLQVTVS